ncbi:MAG TPA: cation diffusion facilitator family transporter [Bryobacteraceae bacterium]|jgi:cation diffusion facilitator family transporter|nr:cation diffusion facilitator family transporter [Bryobacteraceae bacterium]
MDTARRIAILGMTVSGLLAVLKITVGWIGHSASVTADGFESTADVFASGLVLIGLTLAQRPADKNHPYGHGRIEILSGLLLGFLLFDAGCLIAWHGFAGAGDVQTPPHSWAIWPLLVSIAAKLGLVLIKREHGKRIGSSSLLADATNDGIDMLSGLVALGALSLTLHYPNRFPHADHYGAFCVGLIVIGTALRVMHETSLHLLDTMPDDQTIKGIREAALGVPNVKGVEKCFARKTGFKYHVDLHLEVDPEISVHVSHDIAQKVRERIREQLPWVADVLVHVEPWQPVGTLPTAR